MLVKLTNKILQRYCGKEEQKRTRHITAGNERERS